MLETCWTHVDARLGDVSGDTSTACGDKLGDTSFPTTPEGCITIPTLIYQTLYNHVIHDRRAFMLTSEIRMTVQRERARAGRPWSEDGFYLAMRRASWTYSAGDNQSMQLLMPGGVTPTTKSELAVRYRLTWKGVCKAKALCMIRSGQI